MDVFLSHLNLPTLSSVGYFTRQRLEMAPVVSEGLPGAVATASSTQVVWCGVVWIANERRWQCRFPPQEKLCRMPYVWRFHKYGIVSHDASVNSPLTRQMAVRVVKAPPCTGQQPGLEFSSVRTHHVLLLLHWRRCMRRSHSAVPAGDWSVQAGRQNPVLGRSRRNVISCLVPSILPSARPQVNAAWYSQSTSKYCEYTVKCECVSFHPKISESCIVPWGSSGIYLQSTG